MLDLWLQFYYKIYKSGSAERRESSGKSVRVPSMKPLCSQDVSVSWHIDMYHQLGKLTWTLGVQSFYLGFITCAWLIVLALRLNSIFMWPLLPGDGEARLVSHDSKPQSQWLASILKLSRGQPGVIGWPKFRCGQWGPLWITETYLSLRMSEGS